MSKTTKLLVAAVISLSSAWALAQQYGGNVNNANGTVFRSGAGLCWGVGSGNAKANCEPTAAAPVTAQAAATIAPSVPAGPANNNWVNPNGLTWKNGSGEHCWRNNGWSAESAAQGCGKPPVAAAVVAPVVEKAAPAPVEAPKPVAKAAAPAPAPAVVAAPVAGVQKVTYQADAFFDFDKSVLKPEGKAKIDKLVQDMANVKLEVVIAVGHTDSVGSDAYNDKLSMQRAEAVKAYMVGKGVDAGRVYTEGKGERQPAADNKTKEGRAKNRRVEIEVVGTR